MIDKLKIPAETIRQNFYQKLIKNYKKNGDVWDIIANGLQLFILFVMVITFWDSRCYNNKLAIFNFYSTKPYLSSDVNELNGVIIDTSFIRINFILYNGGTTPARNVQCRSFLNMENIYPAELSAKLKREMTYDTIGVSLFPNKPLYLISNQMMLMIEDTLNQRFFPNNRETVKSMLLLIKKLFFHILVTYDNINNKTSEYHATFMIEIKNVHGFEMTVRKLSEKELVKW